MSKNRNPQVDAYVEKSADFARPILEKIREAFHAGCPGIEEKIKWGVPSFEWQGMLGGMAAFKQHVGFGFWKSRLMPEFERTFGRPGRASAMGARVESVKDLPTKKVLVSFVQEAKRLNEESVQAPKRSKAKETAGDKTPADLKAVLAKNTKAKAFFATLAPSAKRDYVLWLTEAKRPETRAKRLATTLEWLAEGKRRNWKYERPKKGT